MTMNDMMNVVVDDGRYVCQPIMDGADRLQVCFASPLGELRLYIRCIKWKCLQRSVLGRDG